MTQAQPHNDGELLPVRALFSYDVLDAETQEFADKIVYRIRQRNISMAQAYIDNGKDLLAARERIPAGMWQSWLEDNLYLTQSNAAKMMKIARLFGDIQLAESHVSVAALHLVANQDIPDAIRQNAVELIKANRLSTESEVFAYTREQYPQITQKVTDRTGNRAKSITENRHIVQHLTVQIAEMSFAVRNMQMALAQSYGVPLRTEVADALQRLQVVSDSLIHLAPREQTNRPRQGIRVSRETTSRYVGVSFHKSEQKWKSALRVNGKRQHLGTFATEEEAARAYDAKARELYGDQARLNFPDEV